MTIEITMTRVLQLVSMGELTVNDYRKLRALEASAAELQRQLADAQALIVELEGDLEGDLESETDNYHCLPKYARYAIDAYRKKYPK